MGAKMANAIFLVNNVTFVGVRGRGAIATIPPRSGPGFKRTPKSFDLSKIRAKSLKIWAKPLQKWRPTLFDFKKCRPTFAEKHMRIYFRGHTKNRLLHDMCGRKYVG